MPFVKGHKKIGGIQKGQQHGKTKAAAQIVEAFYGGKSVIQRLLELAQKNPRDELDILKAILPYCHPKLVATEVTQPEKDSDEKVQELKEKLITAQGLTKQPEASVSIGPLAVFP